jgi:membrane protein DedA with SNARE-associated domain
VRPLNLASQRWTRAAVFAAIAVGTAASWSATALTALLATRHPSWLLILNSAGRNILLTPAVPLPLCLAIATVRRVGGAALYFAVGQWYGEAALAKIGVRRGNAPTSFERFVRAALFPLVAVLPDALVSTIAGATKMRPRTYFALSTLGSIACTLAFRLLGHAIAGPMHTVLAAMQRHAWPLTAAIGVALGVAVLGRVTLKRTRLAVQPVTV